VNVGPDGRHGPHVIVGDVARPEPADEDRHHLDRVLRVRAGDPVTVGDGAGNWRRCRWGRVIEPVGEIMSVAAPEPRLSVGFALIKGGRPELVVQKLVELGVDDIRPFRADRSVVRWDEERSAKNHGRLVRVAREAVMQCRRAWLPEVHPVVPFEEVAALPDVAQADFGGEPVGPEHRCILVGPEGGWSDTERALGLRRVAISDAILRAETAAITAGVLLSAQRGRS